MFGAFDLTALICYLLHCILSKSDNPPLIFIQNIRSQLVVLRHILRYYFYHYYHYYYCYHYYYYVKVFTIKAIMSFP